jgi:hypothetical protein
MSIKDGGSISQLWKKINDLVNKEETKIKVLPLSIYII